MVLSSILIRTDKQTHRSLLEDAKRDNVSLNDLCCQRVLIPSMLQAYPDELRDAIQLARRVAGPSLAGILVFGSWAKGTQRDSSDLDILIVLNRESSLSRQLYRNWQKGAGALEICEPHFVVLPKKNAHVSSLWAEVAIDGSILFDTSNRILEYLRTVRTALINQELYPKQAHGQTYWVHKKVS